MSFRPLEIEPTNVQFLIKPVPSWKYNAPPELVGQWFPENVELVTVKVPPEIIYTAPPCPLSPRGPSPATFPENVELVTVKVPPDKNTAPP
jgi:hypothetical protein